MTRSIFPCLLVTILLGLSAMAMAGERDQLPLGHPDFYPSPRHPIGWRGDGNGAFPGATVVATFGDGVPKQGEAIVIHHGKPVKAQKPYIDWNTAKPTNIAWKFPLPGFTMSQPIIVGDRAIQTCEPRTILCIDMKTGKELWRRELDPFAMIGVTGKEREEALLLESTGWTLLAIKDNLFGNYTRLPEVVTPEVRKNLLEQIGRIRSVLDQAAPVFPEMAKAPLEGLDKAEAMLKDDQVVYTKDNKDPNKGAIIGAICGAYQPFLKSFHERYKFHATCHWYSWVGWTWPTPVCDGTWLYVHMCQGQVARISLADGSIGWFRRLHEIPKNYKQPNPRSPLLHDGIMIVSATPGGGIYGLDAETGKELWLYKEVGQENKGDGFHLGGICGTAPTLVHLPGGRTLVAVVEAPEKKMAKIHLLDAKTGKQVGYFEGKYTAPNDPGPSLMSEGDILADPYHGLVLKITADGDRFAMKELWTHTSSWWQRPRPA